MKKYKLLSNAKINLGLNVLDKLENGYHKIDTLMLPINLYDEIVINIDDDLEDILSISSNNKDLPTDSNNLIYKIYKAFYKKTKLKEKAMEVFIEKNIPFEAGLGGGSSNAAFFLKFLNEIHSNVLNFNELIEIAISIGSDIPFFLYNKPARVRGQGEDIELIEGIKNSYNIILVKPQDINISTKIAYNVFDNIKNKSYSDIEKIIDCLKNNYLSKLDKYVLNNLEQSVLSYSEEMNFFKVSLLNLFPKKRFYMSGSGSSFFTFIKPDEEVFVTTRINTFMDNVLVYSCKI